MKLIFIYNADSGLANTVKDIGHKLFVSVQQKRCALVILADSETVQFDLLPEHIQKED
jgi:hypothetical protein